MHHRFTRATAWLVAGSVSLLAVLAAAPAGAESWRVGPAARSLDPRTDSAEFEKRILLRINDIRDRRGRREVRRFDSCADQLAEDWARHLVDLAGLVHRDQSQVLDECGYVWAGETLARGTGLSPRSTVRAWMRSRPHRRVIMKRRATRAGIAVAPTADGELYAVLNFGDHR